MSADTPPEVEERYRRMIMARSSQRRVAMCFEMSQSARAIVRRSLESAGLGREEVASRLVARLYGADLGPEALAACQRTVVRAARRK
jgi:hypothetical protein